MNTRGHVRTIQVCLTVILFSALAYSADSEFVLKSNVDEVRLVFVAVGTDQRYTRDLSASDVAIVDNENIVRSFRSFALSPEARLNLVIVLDGTASVTSDRARTFAEVIQQIEGLFENTRDSVSVLLLGSGQPVWRCLSQCEDAVRPGNLQSLRASGQTPLFDALVLSARTLARDIDPLVRSALIVFSDGEDNYSLNSAQSVARAANISDTTIYSVNLNDNEYSRGSEAMRFLSTATGGLQVARDGVVPVLKRVIDDLHSAYVLTYVPPERTAGPHKVQVFPSRNLGLKLRSRQSYNYESAEEK